MWLPAGGRSVREGVCGGVWQVIWAGIGRAAGLTTYLAIVVGGISSGFEAGDCPSQAALRDAGDFLVKRSVG